MKIKDFAKEITKHEGLKKQVDIAQVMEILKVANKIIGNEDLYKAIRGLEL